MVEKEKKLIRFDLDQFKLHIKINDNFELSLHFDSPSRRFYFTVMALVVHEMQKLGSITSIPMEEHYELLTLLNETVGDSAGSSKKKALIPRIYKKWKSALPDLENAPLFRVLGKTKEYGDATGRTYRFSEEEKDRWANLFEYKGSREKVRLRFSMDKLGASLDDVVITYMEDRNQAEASAWNGFLDTLKKIQKEEQAQEPILMEPGAAPRGPGKWLKASPRWLIFAAGSVALILVIAAVWSLFLRESAPPIEPASVEKMAFPLPDETSIAVLPFVNMSEDPELEYFSDGMTEQIIAALSQVPEMFVIARNSTFTYKGKPVKVQQIAEELGVRYVLEGSVRKAGERVRITAQLIDAITGKHLWAGRYDRELKDIFALQDEITVKTLSMLPGALASRRLLKHTDNLEAYLKSLKAVGTLRTGVAADYQKAQRLAEEAIALDPEFPIAYQILGMSHLLSYVAGKSKSDETLRLAQKLAEKALALDDSEPRAIRLLGVVYMYRRDNKRAISLFQQGLELDPNDPWLYRDMGWILLYQRRPEEALPYLKKAMRLNPLQKKFQSTCLLRVGWAYRLLGRYEEAISALEKAFHLRPGHWSTQLHLVATYIYAGRDEDARALAGEFNRMHPKFSLEKYRKRQPSKEDPTKARYFEALRKAGVK
jgi:adenylate cyclase